MAGVDGKSHQPAPAICRPASWSAHSSLVNHIAPLKLGEFVRPLVAGRYGVPLAEAATTTAVARTLDFAALVSTASASCFAALVSIAAIVGFAVSLSTGASPWLEGLALPAAVVAGVTALLALVRTGARAALVRIRPGLDARNPTFPDSTYCTTSLDRCPANGLRRRRCHNQLRQVSGKWSGCAPSPVGCWRRR